MNSKGSGQAGLLRLVRLVRGFRYQGQIALYALEIQIFKVPSLPHTCGTCRRACYCRIENLLHGLSVSTRYAESVSVLAAEVTLHRRM